MAERHDLDFVTRLDAVTGQRGSLCVGIDPHPASLQAWGLSNDVAGLEVFARTLVASLGETVACFKPQSAFFEAHGPAGLAVLQTVLTDIAATGAVSILDCKRGDIGSTMAAYAQAYLADGAPLAADAITLNPFLGFGALTPAVELAASTGRGVFVLARTSNSEGAAVQLARPQGSVSVAQQIIDEASAANQAAGTPLVGLVIGATLARLDVNLAGFNGWVLAPGVGAQGGDMAGVAGLFGGHARVLPTASRSVANAGPSPVALADAVAELTGRRRD